MITQEEYDKFIAALTSGKYKQTRACLHNPDTNGFCCLGVFKAAVDGDKPLLVKRAHEQIAEHGHATGDMITSFDIYEDLRQRLGRDMVKCLMDKNDMEISFVNIATYLIDHKDKIVQPVS